MSKIYLVIPNPNSKRSMKPVLYSFRRCPYAIRARLAIRCANQVVDLREVVLRSKPQELAEVSPKATVPVLVIDDLVVDESLEIMRWALEQSDPLNWLHEHGGKFPLNHPLIVENDGQFKQILDKYKYFDRFPEYTQDHYFQLAKGFLDDLENQLISNNGFLSSKGFGLLDAAILPFVRQFAHVDLKRWESLEMPRLKDWLAQQLQSELFISVMNKYAKWEAGLENSIEF